MPILQVFLHLMLIFLYCRAVSILNTISENGSTMCQIYRGAAVTGSSDFIYTQKCYADGIEKYQLVYYKDAWSKEGRVVMSNPLEKGFFFADTLAPCKVDDDAFIIGYTQLSGSASFSTLKISEPVEISTTLTPLSGYIWVSESQYFLVMDKNFIVYRAMKGSPKLQDSSGDSGKIDGGKLYDFKTLSKYIIKAGGMNFILAYDYTMLKASRPVRFDLPDIVSSFETSSATLFTALIGMSGRIKGYIERIDVKSNPPQVLGNGDVCSNPPTILLNISGTEYFLIYCNLDYNTLIVPESNLIKVDIIMKEIAGGVQLTQFRDHRLIAFTKLNSQESIEFDIWEIMEYLPCHESCETCKYSTLKSGCTSCRFGLILDHGSCTSCPSNYPYTKNNTCYGCPGSCSSCNEDGTCAGCAFSNYVLDEGECVPCPLDCLICKAHDVCISCRSPMWLTTRGKCRQCTCSSCADRVGCQSCNLKDQVLVDGDCVQCPQGCTSCNPILECIGTCKKGYYKSNNVTCAPCPDYCSECDREGICIEISNNLFIQQARLTNLSYDIKLIVLIDERIRSQIVLEQDFFDVMINNSESNTDSFIKNKQNYHAKNNLSLKQGNHNRILKDALNTTTIDKSLEFLTSIDKTGRDCILIRMIGFEDGEYNLTISPQATSPELKGNGQVSVVKYNLSDQRLQAELASDIGQITGILSKGTVNVVFLLNVLDTLTMVNFGETGILLKFSMIIKLLNRLRFINVRFGMVLDTFMDMVRDSSSNYVAVDMDRVVKQSTGLHGKFFEYEIELEFLNFMLPSLICYGLLFFIKLILRFTLNNNKKYPKYAYIMMNLLDRLHLLFFIMTFTDVTFYGTRTLMHANVFKGDNKLKVNYIAAICVYLILGIDFSVFIKILLKLQFDTDVHNFHNTIFLRELSRDEIDREKKRIKLKVQMDLFYEVDHEKTKRAIREGYNKIAFLLGDFQNLDSIINGISFKLCLFLNIFRFSFYQILMCVFQSAPLLSALMVLFIELCTFSLNVYFLSSLRKCWTTIRTLNKIIQNFGIASFNSICVYLAWNVEVAELGEPVSIYLQDLALFVILVCLMMEYVFMVISIIPLIQQYCRSSKLSQETRYLKGFYSIKYKEMTPEFTPNIVYTAGNLQHRPDTKIRIDI